MWHVQIGSDKDKVRTFATVGLMLDYLDVMKFPEVTIRYINADQSTASTHVNREHMGPHVETKSSS